MSTIRIDPSALRRAAIEGAEQTARWSVAASELMDVLAWFRLGTTDHLPGLPDLPGDLLDLARHAAQLDEKLEQIAAAFEGVDGQLGMGTVHVTTDLDLASRISPPALPTYELTALRLHLQQTIDRHDSVLARADAVAILMRGLARQQQIALALTSPDLVGPTDGVPPELRYIANRVLVERELVQATAELDVAGDEADDRLQGRVDNLRRLLEPVVQADLPAGTRQARSRQVLLFDPSGDGQVVEVFGNLGTAEHVATFVPGITNRLDNFANTSGNAQRLYTEAEKLTPGSTATIAWLGYDTPEFADAPSRQTADTWASTLAEFQTALPASLGVRDAHTTVIGHSYGSLLTGVAIREEGLTADAFAVIGSPGLNVGHARELGLLDGTTLYAGRAHNDPVSLSESHGADPATPWFGSIPFDTGDIAGHSSYTNEQTVSLANLALIITGRGDNVSVDGLDVQDMPRAAIPVVGPAVDAVSTSYRLIDCIAIGARDAGDAAARLASDVHGIAAGAVSWTDDQLDQVWLSGGQLAGAIGNTVTTTLDHIRRTWQP